jgi:formyltetrahydrofolate-dependent phosphoribosylglycinamide formyltransferase
MPTSPINLAVLLSGSGTTLQNLIDHIAAKKLDARIKLVIGSRDGLLGIQRAMQAGIPSHIVDRKRSADVASFSQRVFELIDEAQVDLVCLAGWLCLLDLPGRYDAKMMNIHPALLPSFGGKGMYGAKVHQAVLDHGCKVSGCTVHFVDASYDSGPIILQRTCPVLEDDTPQTLARRVFEEEKIAYPAAIRLFADGKLRIEGQRVRVME